MLKNRSPIFCAAQTHFSAKYDLYTLYKNHFKSIKSGLLPSTAKYFKWSIFMTINELKGLTMPKSISPMTPEKARINSLKQVKDTASTNLKKERDRQKLAKAQQQISTITTGI